MTEKQEIEKALKFVLERLEIMHSIYHPTEIAQKDLRSAMSLLEKGWGFSFND